jgi:hypothetical protein
MKTPSFPLAVIDALFALVIAGIIAKIVSLVLS